MIDIVWNAEQTIAIEVSSIQEEVHVLVITIGLVLFSWEVLTIDVNLPLDHWVLEACTIVIRFLENNEHAVAVIKSVCHGHVNLG